MLSNSECCQTDRGYYTVLLRQRLKSTENGCVHMTVCSSLAYSRPHCHHALALDSVRWHCAHVQFCPPCSTIHHPVTEYKTFSVALLTMQHPAPLPVLHFLLQPFRSLAVTACFLLQLFWFLPLLSAQTSRYLSIWNTSRCLLCSSSTGIGAGCTWSSSDWQESGGKVWYTWRYEMNSFDFRKNWLHKSWALNTLSIITTKTYFHVSVLFQIVCQEKVKKKIIIIRFCFGNRSNEKSQRDFVLEWQTANRVTKSKKLQESLTKAYSRSLLKCSHLLLCHFIYTRKASSLMLVLML